MTRSTFPVESKNTNLSSAKTHARLRIGISAAGYPMFNTPFGDVDYHGNRLRVTDGGQCGNADITLQNARGNASEWSGVLTNAGVLPVGPCYAAVQWYRDGQPSSIGVQLIGILNPRSPVTVNIKANAPGGGTYSFYLWSGESEIRPRIIEGPEW